MQFFSYRYGVGVRDYVRAQLYRLIECGFDISARQIFRHKRRRKAVSRADRRNDPDLFALMIILFFVLRSINVRTVGAERYYYKLYIFIT